jgi:hypothetical protein
MTRSTPRTRAIGRGDHVFVSAADENMEDEAKEPISILGATDA